MRTIVMLCLVGSMSCAYGSAEPPQKVYGHTNTNTNGDAATTPPNDNGYEDESYSTGCFNQNIFGNGMDQAPTSYVVICDGQKFTIKDLVDPDPTQYQK